MYQLLGVGVLRIFQNLIGQTAFNDLAVQHNHGSVRQHPDDRRSWDTSRIEMPVSRLDLADKIQHLCLDGQVQTGGHLIQQEQ